MKAEYAHEVKKFQDIPNVGPAVERDLRLLSFTDPKELVKEDPYKLYKKLEELTSSPQDPCVLDTFIAITDFMSGAHARPWFWHTQQRKKDFPHN